jgi:small subunit ribosomal protein S27e
MKEPITMPESKFLKVACKKCKNEQIIFNKPVTLVKCTKCGEILAEPTGGEAIINAKILQPLS